MIANSCFYSFECDRVSWLEVASLFGLSLSSCPAPGIGIRIIANGNQMIDRIIAGDLTSILIFRNPDKSKLETFTGFDLARWFRAAFWAFKGLKRARWRVENRFFWGGVISANVGPQ